MFNVFKCDNQISRRNSTEAKQHKLNKELTKKKCKLSKIALTVSRVQRGVVQTV